MSSNLVLEKDPAKRPAFAFTPPSGYMHDTSTAMPWTYWAALHKTLGQELAKRMRVYPGPSTNPDGGDIGGTPAAMPARVAA